MENYLYRCQYCGKDYKPNRRKKQKYCSNSCRTRAFVTKNSTGLSIVKTDIEKKEPFKKPTKIDKMSLAGVGNAAAGALAVNVITNLLTSEENKPATRKDLQNLANSLKQRYYPVLNLPNRVDGSKPFYDIQTQNIIFRKFY